MRCRVAIEKRKTNKQRVDTQKLVNVQKRVQTQKSFQNLFGHENNYNGKAKEVYKSIEYALQNDSGGGLGETLKSILDVISRTTINMGEGPYLHPKPRFYPEVVDKLITFDSGTPVEYDRPFGGWVKFKVKGYDEEDEIFQKHLVAYHGTSAENICSILKNGLMSPASMGKSPEHGDALRGEGEEKGHRIYVSPCINYAAHPVYSPLHKIKHNDFIVNKQFVQFVLQVRVAPGSYTTYGSTLGSHHWPKDCSFDPAFEPDDVYEWVTRNPPAVTGLFLRVIGKRGMESVFGKFASNNDFRDEYDWTERCSSRIEELYKKFR